MNTVVNVTEDGNYTITDNDDILNSVLASLCRNNTFCPNIKKLTTDKDGALSISFADGTWVTVKKCDEDEDDMSTAIVYGIVKRIFGKPTPGGYIEGCGFLNKIKKMTEEIITPEKIEKDRIAKIEAKKEADRKAHEDAVMRRQRHPSNNIRMKELEDNVNTLTKNMNRLIKIFSNSNDESKVKKFKFKK